jgi:hypothetical protein
MYKNLIIILFLGSLVLSYSCKKKDQSQPTGDITIVSLSATLNPVKAWDTTLITVSATGSNLQYGWEADHGSIVGSGPAVKYAAGECCVGMNTITCRVFNDTGEVSDTIKIRVTSYFWP